MSTAYQESHIYRIAYILLQPLALIDLIN